MEINNVAVRLTAEPDELRTTPSGKQVVSFSAAYNWRTRTDGGFTDVETTFFRCTLWAKTERPSSQLSDSARATVSGSLADGRRAPGSPRTARPVSATT